jgi:hypothetical protein
MRGQAGFFDIDERLKELSAKGDSLERLNGVVAFELFRVDLERAISRGNRAVPRCRYPLHRDHRKRGRPRMGGEVAK